MLQTIRLIRKAEKEAQEIVDEAHFQAEQLKKETDAKLIDIFREAYDGIMTDARRKSEELVQNTQFQAEREKQEILRNAEQEVEKIQKKAIRNFDTTVASIFTEFKIMR